MRRWVGRSCRAKRCSSYFSTTKAARSRYERATTEGTMASKVGIALLNFIKAVVYFWVFRVKHSRSSSESGSAIVGLKKLRKLVEEK